MKYIEITINNELFQIRAEKRQGQIWFHFKGRTFVLNQQNTKTLSLKTDQPPVSLNQGRILSPMPGQIIKVSVCSGQTVKENQTLLILSSMKMEYIIRSPAKAQVKSVQVQEGAQVSAQELLMEISILK